MARQAPQNADPSILNDREVMLSRLAEQRVHTLSVLVAGRDTDLRISRLQHPFLGGLHYYDWFRTLAAHDARHAKPLNEVVKVHKSS
jgi:hypothetical protein